VDLGGGPRGGRRLSGLKVEAGPGISVEDCPLTPCRTALFRSKPLKTCARPSDPKVAARQDMVGIVNRVLPLTGRLGGAQDRSTVTSSITLSCEPKRPRVARGSGFDWRVKRRFTLRVVTCPISGAL
jgi:hypothetical protein